MAFLFLPGVAVGVYGWKYLRNKGTESMFLIHPRLDPEGCLLPIEHDSGSQVEIREPRGRKDGYQRFVVRRASGVGYFNLRIDKYRFMNYLTVDENDQILMTSKENDHDGHWKLYYLGQKVPGGSAFKELTSGSMDYADRQNTWLLVAFYNRRSKKWLGRRKGCRRRPQMMFEEPCLENLKENTEMLKSCLWVMDCVACQASLEEKIGLGADAVTEVGAASIGLAKDILPLVL